MVLPSVVQSILSLTAVSSSTINITALFGPSLSPAAQIVLCSDAHYTEEITQRWTTHGAPSFLGAIKPATEVDVQNIVKIASKHKIPFLATGGGGSFTTTYEKLHDGIEIDLQNFNSVHLDATNELLTVGGGAVFADIIEPLYAAGKEMVTPSAPCVGIVGMTLGGGVGTLQGIHGLLLDSLESIRLVGSTGNITTASETENAELFWGIRGAGNNFGVITSATYRVHNATNRAQVMNSDFAFPSTANASIWSFLASLDEALPAEMALTVAVAYNRTIEQPVMLVNALFYGPEDQGKTYLGPLFALDPVMVRTVTVPWNAIMNTTFFGMSNSDATGACIPNQHVNIYSIGVNRTDVATWETYFKDLVTFYHNQPGYDGRLLVQRYATQGVLAVPDDATAYPHRQIKTHIDLEGFYQDTALDSAVDTFMRSSRSLFHRTSSFPDPAPAVVNYAHGDEGPASWYSERKLERLSALKKVWDPTEIFSWGNPIPLPRSGVNR